MGHKIVADVAVEIVVSSKLIIRKELFLLVQVVGIFGLIQWNLGLIGDSFVEHCQAGPPEKEKINGIF